MENKVIMTGLKDLDALLKYFRDSKILSEMADVIIFLYRDDYYLNQSENAGKAELIVAKHPVIRDEIKTIMVAFSREKGFCDLCRELD